MVVFLPFPTRLIAEALNNTSGERVYVTMYGLTILAIRVLGSALDAYARYEHLYSPEGEGEELQTTQRKFLPVVIGYVIAIIIGLLCRYWRRRFIPVSRCTWWSRSERPHGC